MRLQLGAILFLVSSSTLGFAGNTPSYEDLETIFTRQDGITLVPRVTSLRTIFTHDIEYLSSRSDGHPAHIAARAMTNNKVVVYPGGLESDSSTFPQIPIEQTERYSLLPDNPRDKEVATCLAKQENEIKAILPKAKPMLQALGLTQIHFNLLDSGDSLLDSCLETEYASPTINSLKNWRSFLNQTRVKNGDAIASDAYSCNDGHSQKPWSYFNLRSKFPGKDAENFLELYAVLGAPAKEALETKRKFDELYNAQRKRYLDDKNNFLIPDYFKSREPVPAVILHGPIGCKIATGDLILKYLNQEVTKKLGTIKNLNETNSIAAASRGARSSRVNSGRRTKEFSESTARGNANGNGQAPAK